MGPSREASGVVSGGLAGGHWGGVRGLGRGDGSLRRLGCWPFPVPRTPPGFAENPSVCVVCRAALRRNPFRRFPQA